RSWHRRRRVVGQVRCFQRVRPLIVQHVAAHAAQPSIPINRYLDIPDLIALLDGADAMLATVLHPLQRRAEQTGGTDDRYLLRVDAILRAKSAAYVRRDDAHEIVRQSCRRDDGLVQIVRHLRGGPDAERSLTRTPLR